MKFALAAVLLTASCVAHVTGTGRTRFANQDPVWIVNDRADIPQPAKRRYYQSTHSYDRSVLYPVTAALSLPLPVRAANTNALDEVPDSTWFTNRIGRFALRPDHIRRGPEAGGDPTEHAPWTVVSAKVGGTAPGLVVEDSAGERYLLKFDVPGFPEHETGAHAIVQRILWAAGYNVPDDRVVYFSRDQIRLGPESTVSNELGDDRPMTARDLEMRLDAAQLAPGEPIRALASRFVDGVPVGGFADVGTRRDDPNDRVPHERRRELRGLQPLAAWLGHTDVKESNTVDAWTPDRADPEIHYLVHYLIDFGKALGNAALIDPSPSSGFAHAFDWAQVLLDLFSLGLRPRPWDGLTAPHLRGVGLFESERYDPGGFRTNVPFIPFEVMDRTDGFWGAKLMMRFTPAHLRAAVEAARYSDPAATAYILRTLRERQLETARHWFSKVTPADAFEVEVSAAGTRLCFLDLMEHYRLETASAAEYTARVYDFDGRPLEIGPTPPRLRPRDRPGAVCTGAVASPLAGYVIFEVSKRGRRGWLPSVSVHVTGDRPRVIGIERR